MELEILVQQNGVNKLLDLMPDTSFSINYEIADVNDISDSNGAYTKTITIPDTKNNRQIFGYITELSIDLEYGLATNNPFNPNKKTPCIVLEQSIPVMSGYIQFNKFSIDGVNNFKTMDVTIYASNVNFWNSMGDSYLTDLDFSEYNFTYSLAALQTTWNNNPDAYKLGYYFPLIDYGNKWTLDYLNNTVLTDNGISNVLYQLQLSDFKPAIFAKTILDKIFLTHSFYYQSNFLGSSNKSNVVYPNPYFGNLIIPYNNQRFQAGTLFNQDKIFHVGLTTSTLGQYSDYDINIYQGVGCTFSGIADTIVNIPVNNGGGTTYENVKRYLWYDGYLLSPFQQYLDRNTHHTDTDSTYTFDQVIIPFGLTASPMFETFDSSGNPSYNTGPALPDFNYQNRTGGTGGSLFKQRFVLNTDIVTLYSNQGNIDRNYAGSNGATAVGTSFNYVCYVGFYREFNPALGLTSCADWLGGTGFPIPADLGGVAGTINMCCDITGATDSLHHWVCDYKNKSNCFDKNGTLIVPTGGNRYLGKYNTSYLGDNCFQSGGGSASQNFPNASGDCISWYYNDGANQTSLALQGLWCSGFNLPEMGTIHEATTQAPYGDWYQQLQLQTIYLDNNPEDILYGNSGTILQNGNIPIYHGERVRCIIFFGGKYHGQQITGTPTSYAPPSAGYVLTSTNFLNDNKYPYGNYQYPATQPDGNGNLTNSPLTTFYNDVSTDYINGQAVNFNDCVPKNVKQRDFILDIVNLHNLYIEPSKENPNTLIIEPREDYYALATQSLDWSNKIDLTQPIDVQILAETQNRTTLFTYKNDKDFWNAQYTQYTNQVYGQQLYSVDNDFLTDTKTIQSLFSPTPVVQLFSTFANSGNDTLATPGGFVIPQITSGTNQTPSTSEAPGGTPQFNYRILLKNYIENQNSDQIYLFGSFTHSYPYAGPYDNPYNPQYTLNWGQTLGEFFDTTTTNFPNNLVNVYWANLLTELTDIDSRIITVSMFLTAQDINSFHFYNLVFVTIDGVDGYYKVNGIEDYVPGVNSTCKVTLLKSNVS